MSETSTLKTDAKVLLQIMDIPADPALPWTAVELAALLRHQLRVSIEPEVERFLPALSGQTRQLCGSVTPPITTFLDALLHPESPLELLRIVKEVMKISPYHPDYPIPRETASVIYFAAIVVAQKRYQQSITNLTSENLNHAIEWVISQSWIDPDIRVFFEGR